MDFKELALGHFEKAVLALGVVWLGFAAVSMAGTPAELASADKLNGYVDEISTYMDADAPGAATAPGWLSGLRGRLDPTGVGAAKPYPGWVLHKRPTYLYSTKAPPPKHTARHEAPDGVTAAAGARGQIDVTWQPASGNEYVLVTRYEIERRVGTDGEWTSVGEVDGNSARSYADTEIASRTEYYYRVISHAEIDQDNPVVRDEDMELAAAEATKTSDEAGPAMTARDVFIFPTQVTEVTMDDLVKDPNAKEQAHIKVYKWDPTEEKFVTATFYGVQIGQAIGEVKKRRGREIDFRTGAVLVDVEVRKRDTGKGYSESLYVIKFRFEDGSEEEANHKDKPAELEDIR